MAAAESRAAWQRTANRCFVQEDAKRAPKLASCQSSSATSKLVDSEPANAVDRSDHTAVGFMPFNRKSSFSNLSPDTRWWLHLQPCYGDQKGLTYEQLKVLEDDMETLRARNENKTSNLVHPLEGDFTCIDHYKDQDSSPSLHYAARTDVIDKSTGVREQETYSKNAQIFPELMDMKGKCETAEMDPVGFLVSKQPNEFCMDPESPWVGGGNTEPWWRTTDRDELASLVVQKSLDHIENCDLPPPQKYVRRYPYGNIIDDKMIMASFDWKSKSGGLYNITTRAEGSPDSGIVDGKHGASANRGHLHYVSDKLSSYTTTDDVMEMQQVFEGDPGKSKLMEALRHSQTRAREAEEAAKQACAEKEHIIKLFFRQASQLFAYKQWFQLLQLETLYSQVKNNDQPISILFPMPLPWMSLKGRKSRKRWQKFSKGRQGKHGRLRNDITTYAVAFALGLSLVGAGLLLGWTVGWMLPPF
ncbi:Transmembrane protein [Quillaja saponaria]|uniref:Transmembrane protein n=1 Tax=Quillaja saponaria TaxID=32244 RepID=A0AAD7LQM3_QUISA|nr:Transmembrane protein [Quillaja saponaria]